MPTTSILPTLLKAVVNTITDNADALTELDQALGDGDHVTNLQRGLQALLLQSEELSKLDWQSALQKMGMTIMSSVGGASGSLYGTLFVTMSKNIANQSLTTAVFADAYLKGVEAVKLRGKADKGEKTMLDVLVPVAEQLHQHADTSIAVLLNDIQQTVVAGAESTRDMVATKGRASFLGERSKGHIDAGAKSSQLMICAIANVLASPTQ